VGEDPAATTIPRALAAAGDYHCKPYLLNYAPLVVRTVVTIPVDRLSIPAKHHSVATHELRQGQFREPSQLGEA
jgi:hypothetical protein